jgi:hypothetical protein
MRAGGLSMSLQNRAALLRAAAWQEIRNGLAARRRHALRPIPSLAHSSSRPLVASQVFPEESVATAKRKFGRFVFPVCRSEAWA